MKHWSWAWAGFGLAVAVSRFALRAPAPDGFDSIDFLLGMSRGFDLAKLQPHFPGYPVYVALGAALYRLGVPVLAAAEAVSAAASGVAAVALAACARRLGGEKAAWAAGLLHGVAWLPMLLGSGALSDALAVAWAALAVAFLAAERPRPGLSALCAALMLGTRLSYWPLALAYAVWAWRVLADRPAHARWALAGGVGLLGWSVPLLALVGPSTLWTLGLEHVRGHFTGWGGSALTRPGWGARSLDFLRDVAFDGLSPAWPALAGVALLGALAAWLGRSSPLPYRKVGLALAPYAVWVLVAQNVAEQPRHLLPLVEAGVVLLGCLLSTRRWTVAGAAACALAFNAPLAWAHHRVPAAGAQAAGWVSEQGAPDQTTVMAGRSWRYFFELSPPVTVRQHAYLSEVLVDLSRFDRFPERIWLTSEVDLHSGGGVDTALPQRWRVDQGPRFCRDERIDRADPCLSLRRLTYQPP